MWKHIDTNLILQSISKGNLVTNNPKDLKQLFEVLSTDVHGYIKLMRVNGTNDLRYFPIQELLIEKWWVKQNVEE